MKRKILALALAICLILSNLPLGVLAEAGAAPVPDAAQTEQPKPEGQQKPDGEQKAAEEAAAKKAAEEKAEQERKNKLYTVTVAGGSAQPAQAKMDTPVILTADAAPDGQRFTGWQVLEGNISVIDNGFTMPEGNVKVRALYEEAAARREPPMLMQATNPAPAGKTTLTVTGITLKPIVYNETDIGEIVSYSFQEGTPEGVTLTGYAFIANGNVGTNAVEVTSLKLGGANAGNYVLANKSFETTITITPRPIDVIPPQPIPDLVETGAPQMLITAGKHTAMIDGVKKNAGTMYYQLEQGGKVIRNWMSQIPEATDAGTYEISYKVIAGTNFQSVEPVRMASSVTIKPKPVTSTVTVEDAVYNGKEQTPTVTVMVGGVTLNPETDYTVTYENNVNAGTAKVIVSPKAGSSYNVTRVEQDFSIAALPLTEEMITVSSLTYNGQPQTPTVTVKAGETILKDTDYTVEAAPQSNAGTYRLTVKGQGSNVRGTVEVSWGIGKVQLTVTPPQAVSGLTYDETEQTLVSGGSISPADAGMVLRYRLGSTGTWGTGLPAARDAGSYVVQYQAAAETDGNYLSSEIGTLTVTIAQTRKAKTEAHPIGDSPYNGMEQYLLIPGEGYDRCPMVYSLSSNGPFVPDTPRAKMPGTYDLYWKCEAPADAKNVIYGEVHYLGSATITSIETTATLSLEAGTYTYNGKAHTPKATVTFQPEGPVLGTDYTVTCQNNVDAGTAKVIVAPVAGSAYDFTPVEQTFSIEKADIRIHVNDMSIPYGTSVEDFPKRQEPTFIGIPEGGAQPEFSGDPFALDSRQYKPYLRNVGEEMGPDCGISATGTTIKNYNIIEVINGKILFTPAQIPLKAPTAANLTYTGGAQALLAAPAVITEEHAQAQCQIRYKLGEGTWGTEIPQATEAGTYTVFYQAVGTLNAFDKQNYSDTEIRSVQVKIGKLPTAFTPQSLTLTYSGQPQELLTAPAVPEGRTVQYRLEGGSWSEAIPTAKDAGSYTVFYQVDGGTNYESLPEASLVTEIQKASLDVNMFHVLDKNPIYDGKPQRPTVLAGDRYTGVGEITVKTSGTNVADCLQMDKVEFHVAEGTNFLAADLVKWEPFRIRPQVFSSVEILLSADDCLLLTGPAEPGVQVKAPDGTVLSSPDYQVSYEGNNVPNPAALVRITAVANGNYSFPQAEKTFVTRGEQEVKTSDLQVLQEREAEIRKQLETCPPESQEALQAELNRITARKEQIKTAQAAAGTEAIRRTETVTETNVKLEDDAALHQARTDLEKALAAPEAGLYTEAEKQHLETRLENVKKAQAVLQPVKQNVIQVAALPETVEPDESQKVVDLIAAARKDYEVLTDYQKTLAQPQLQKLEKLRKDLVNYKVIKNPTNQWAPGDGDVTFTFNGRADKFVALYINGSTLVNPANYEVISGSTIIILKQSFVKTLTPGDYTLTPKYIDSSDPDAKVPYVLVTVLPVSEKDMKKALENRDYIAGIKEETVKSTDKKGIEDSVKAMEDLIKNGKISDAEKDLLKKSVEQAKKLLAVIQAAADAAATAAIQNTGYVSKDNVALTDKAALEQAQADLNAAVKNYKDHYTEDELQAIRNSQDRVAAALNAISRAENVIWRINNLPAIIGRTDHKAMKDAVRTMEAYEGLTRHERALVTRYNYNKLMDRWGQFSQYVFASMEPEKEGTVRFTVNGPFKNYMGLKIDDKAIPEEDITVQEARSSSGKSVTMITFAEDLTRKLGKTRHRIDVDFDGGIGLGVMDKGRIPDGRLPRTGDAFRAGLWITLLAGSAVGIGAAAFFLLKKKKK